MSALHLHRTTAEAQPPKISKRVLLLEKDIALHQVLQLLSDLVLKHYYVLTLAHVFI